MFEVSGGPEKVKTLLLQHLLVHVFFQFWIHEAPGGLEQYHHRTGASNGRYSNKWNNVTE